jgi:hypothetical protein
VVEAANESARVEEGAGPRVDPQAFGAMRLAIPSKTEPVSHASLPTCAIPKMTDLQTSPVSHAQARIIREQDSGADLEPPPHSVLPPNRAVEPLEPAPHERARARAETGELPKSSRDEGTCRTTRPEDRALMRTSEGKAHPGATHGRPPEPPSLRMGSPIAWAPNRVDPKPEGRSSSAAGRSGGEGARSDSWPQPGTVIEGQYVHLRGSALLEGEQNNLQVGSEQAVTRPTPNLAQIPVNTHDMPNSGLPGPPAEGADEGGGARATANGADPAYGVFDIPEGPRGLERALASTAVDSEAAGPCTVESRCRTNWPAQENATEPRPPSQKPTRTRGVEGEPPWEGINEKQRGTEAHQAESVRNAAAHCKMHLQRPKDFCQRGGADNDGTYAPATKSAPPRATTATANRLSIEAKVDVEGALPRVVFEAVVERGRCLVFGLRDGVNSGATPGAEGRQKDCGRERGTTSCCDRRSAPSSHKSVNPHTKTNVHRSRGLPAWLWPAWDPGRAKALMKPSSWPGLARPTWAWLGPAHGLRPGHAHHYLRVTRSAVSGERRGIVAMIRRRTSTITHMSTFESTSCDLLLPDSRPVYVSSVPS